MENSTRTGRTVEKGVHSVDGRISVAPMMDWTDRHCRYFLRGFGPSALLYTEMITAEALLRGDTHRLLHFDPAEQPVALQLGGSDPVRLAAAARLGAEAGYVEINLNCGCPSDRVHAGAFGACLMREPQRVAECVSAMRAVVAVPVTVKMRIGVIDDRGAAARARVADFDESDSLALHDFIGAVAAAGCQRIVVHARKAVLGGLSPAENRSVPPLRYEVVREIKQRWPALQVVLNGGLNEADAIAECLRWTDGVMVGREAYHRPYLLWELEHRFGRADLPRPGEAELLLRMARYAEAQVALGEPLSSIVRHMLGLYARRSGARSYRRLLSEDCRRDGIAVLYRAAEQAVGGQPEAA